MSAFIAYVVDSFYDMSIVLTLNQSIKVTWGLGYLMKMQPDEIEVYTKEVAAQLGESAETPVQQIARMLEQVGRDFVAELLAEVEKIEADGGLMTDDGSRRRTKGGVFFYLAKGKLPPDARQVVFPNFGQRGTVVEWDERFEHVQKLIEADHHGEMRYVSITLHGRPGDVIVEDNSVITTIAHEHLQTPLPRGVPHPPAEPTYYTVYMAAKQWEEVAETLQKYKADRMIVEGTCFLDQETNSISVHALRVTTKRLEKQVRRAQEPQSNNQKKKKPGKAAKSAETDARQSANDSEKAPDTPPTSADKLHTLQQAAATLRAKIADMEAKGQPGVNMTKRLLQNTEKQIQALEKQAANQT